MTSSNDNQNSWAHYPMGPQLRSWLGYEAADHSSSTSTSNEQKLYFSEFLLSQIETRSLNSESLAGELMDELIAMDLPVPVLKLADQLQQKNLGNSDFARILAEGIAAMQVDELGRAESCFRDAQGIAPEEPAPYINLIQILMHTGRDEEAYSWVKGCLNAEPNYLKLWDLIAELTVSEKLMTAKPDLQKSRPSFVLALAKEHNSWAGLSLAADLDEAANSQTKASFLDEHYHQGERSLEFLLEYTGALGAAGDFEKIPQIIWQATKTTNQQIPWRLEIHGLQAFLAMDQNTQFLEHAEKFLKRRDISPQLREELLNITEEIKTLSKQEESNKS